MEVALTVAFFFTHFEMQLVTVKTLMGSMAVLRLSLTLSSTSQRVQPFLSLETLMGCFHELKQDGKLASDGQRLHVK